MAKDKELTGIPISALIAAPLESAAQASLKLAEATAEYIDNVGFIKRGPNEGQPRQVNFMFERPRQNEQGEVYMEEVHLQVPLLAIAPAPNLQIDSMDVDFNLEIRSVSAESEEGIHKTAVAEDHVQLNGATASHREHTRKTDKSSKYHFELHATNHGVPEALARIVDLMASGVAPHKTFPKTGGERTETKPSAGPKKKRVTKKKT
jgi:hypothetical protein